MAGGVAGDYSLTGERGRRAVANGLAHVSGAKWYVVTDPAQAAEGADAALGRAGDP